MQISPNLGLTIWNLGGDYYNHNELAANWNIVDTQLFKKTGDTATGVMRFQRTSSTADAIEVKLDSDAQARFKIRLDGLYWGDGGGTFDVRLFRGAADVLRTEDQIESTYSGGPSFVSSHSSSLALRGVKPSSQPFIENRINAIDSQPSFQIRGGGELAWGAGGSSATDVRVYRSSPSKLTIEGDLEVEDLVASTLLLGGIPITGTPSGGGGDGDINSSASIVTSSFMRARNGASGAIQLGNIDDPGIAAVYFGGARDVNIYRDGSDRLKTDDTFVVQQKLEVYSTATDSIETEGGLDVAGIGIFGGALSTSSTLSVSSTATVTGGMGVSGRASIGSTYLIGNLFRGRQIWFESSTNSNLWYMTNTASTLEFRTTTFSAGGAGSSDTIRGSWNTSGLVVQGNVTSVGGSLVGAGLNIGGNASINGNLTLTGTINPASLTTGAINGTSLSISSNASIFGLTVTTSINAGDAVVANNVFATGTVNSSGTVVAAAGMQAKNFFISGQAGTWTEGGINVDQDRGYIRSGTAYGAPPVPQNSVIGYQLVAWGGFFSPFAHINAISDINKKTDLTPVNGDELLGKIKSMETLAKWRYDQAYLDELNSISEGTPDVTNDEVFYGPSAQEFNRLFKPEVIERAKNKKKKRGGRKRKYAEGEIVPPMPADNIFEDDKMINIYDIAGIALMGVKALTEKVEELEAKLEKSGV